MKGQAVGIVIAFLLFFTIVLIAAYLLHIFFNFLPAPLGFTTAVYAPITSFITWFFGFVDASFLFLYVFMMLLDVLAAYFRPSTKRALANGILLLALAFFSLVVQLNLSALTFLSPTTYLPLTTSFFQNDYYLVVALFATVASIIFNMKSGSK